MITIIGSYIILFILLALLILVPAFMAAAGIQTIAQLCAGKSFNIAIRILGTIALCAAIFVLIIMTGAIIFMLMKYFIDNMGPYVFWVNMLE